LFLAPLDSLEIPSRRTGPPGYIGWRIHSLESIPGLRKR